MQAKSIGFLPLKYHVPSPQENAQAPVLKEVSRVIDEWLLLEYACTWLPVNPEALVEAISKAQVDVPEEIRKAAAYNLRPAPMERAWDLWAKHLAEKEGRVAPVVAAATAEPAPKTKSARAKPAKTPARKGAAKKKSPSKRKTR